MEQILNMILAIITSLLTMIMSMFGGGGSTPADPTPVDPTPEKPVVITMEYDWPVKSESEVKSGFPSYSDGSYHGGIDIFLTNGKSAGEPFYAAADGTINTAYNDSQYNDGYGNYVIVDHANGTYTIYAHAKDVTVKNGDKVKKGDLLGHIGKTGNATAEHLHFEFVITKSDGTLERVNPLDYVKNTTGPAAKPEELKGTFTFTVYGWGHGVGMSQEGAIQMAKDGKTYETILTTYYPGTSIATDSNTPAKVTHNGKEVTLVEFLCKTVKQEIGSGAPKEALKAQAVAAYTYAKANNNNFSSGQAYDDSFQYDGNSDAAIKVRNAVFEVLGISSSSETPKAKYLSYNGKAAATYYFASSAGKTTAAANVWGGTYESYLKGGVASPEKVEKTTVTLTAKEMYDLIMAYNPNAKLDSNPANWLKIVAHDSAVDSNTGYVTLISVGGTEMSGNKFREKVMKYKIKSHCFTVTYSAS